MKSCDNGKQLILSMTIKVCYYFLLVILCVSFIYEYNSLPYSSMFVAALRVFVKCLLSL
jgi:hypothetical protein